MNSVTVSVSAPSVGNRALVKKLTLFLLISLFTLISLYIFIFAPLYVEFASNVLYMSTILPDAFAVLCSAVDIFVFSVFYGVILYSIYRFSVHKSVRFMVIYGGAVLYKNLGNLLMTFLTDGIPADVLYDVFNALLYIFMEFLQAAIAISIGVFVLSRASKDEKRMQNVATAKGKVYIPKTETLPFSKLYNGKNPVQKATSRMALVPMVVMILSRFYYDIFYTIENGFPSGALNILTEILWMLLYYSMDIVFYGIAVYFIMLFILMHFHAEDKKIEEREKVAAEEDSLFSVHSSDEP